MNNIDFQLVSTASLMKNIAVLNNVSTSKVQRKIKEFKHQIIVNKTTLPKVLGIDEVNTVSKYYLKEVWISFFFYAEKLLARC